MAVNGGTRLRPRGNNVDRVRLLPQVAVMVAAVAAYFLVRGATQAATAEAVRNAHSVVGLERALGLFHEPGWQASVMGMPFLRTVLNDIYIWGHWPVIAVTLIWLARRHPAVYLRARDTMLLSGGIGLIIFTAFPVAPPRLAGLGMSDTVTAGAHAYRVLQPAMFTNQYAAMPSLHVGWDLVMGLAIATASGHLLLRLIAVTLPVAMVITVLCTANHYLVDAIAGAALTTLCWLIVGSARRARRVEPLPRGDFDRVPALAGRR
ncbi:inositol phosphorylceramide synthase [Paractinoplanes toevensis]|uniref:Inositol phosphorylceramide synthase n=1 Tax=Paractinoplanes toevensis TaxID=571911 RepID=A0A919T8Q1_9ACTN|nr:inositol phosphorylceramide synthase [Actinoplanes toevensis]